MMITQANIAEKVGVSRTAVGLVLSGMPENLARVTPELRQRIERAARELGYISNRAAQQLKGKPSGVFGAIAKDWNNSIGERFLSWAARAADQRGYKLLTAEFPDTPDATEAFTNSFVGRGVDGYLYFAWNREDDWPTVARLLGAQKNAVVIGGRPPIPGVRHVTNDYRVGDRQALDHLVAIGRRRVGLVAIDPPTRACVDAELEFLAGSSRHHLPGADGRIFRLRNCGRFTAVDLEGPCAAVADDAVAAGVDSLLCIADTVASLVIRRLRARGVRVPEDVSIVGRMNDLLAHFFDPPLTTITYRLDLLAAKGLDVLLANVPGRGLGSDGVPPAGVADALVPAELVVRGSTASTNPSA